MSALFEPNVCYQLLHPTGPGAWTEGFQVGVWSVTCRRSWCDPDAGRCRQSLVRFHDGWHVDHWPSGRLLAQLADFPSALLVADEMSIAAGDAESPEAVTRALRASDLGAWLNTVTPSAPAISLRAWRASRSAAP